ncbi:MAG: T9SS type A sorting domain-containing protein, partial [Bacteroidota bacterium]
NNDWYGRRIDQTNLRVLSPPANGTATVWSDTLIRYEPNPDFFGTDTFTYLLFDSLNAAIADTAWVTVVVTPVNDAPIATQLDTIVARVTDPILVDVGEAVLNVENDVLTFEFDSLVGPGSYIRMGIPPFSGAISVSFDSTALDGDSLVIPYKVCDLTVIPPVNLCDSSRVVVYFRPQITSIHDREEKEWIIYPNPVEDNLTIHASSEEQIRKVNFLLTNAQGQEVWSLSPEAANHVRIPMANLPQGIYFLRIVDDGRIFSRKVVKAGL